MGYMGYSMETRFWRPVVGVGVTVGDRDRVRVRAGV